MVWAKWDRPIKRCQLHLFVHSIRVQNRHPIAQKMTNTMYLRHDYSGLQPGVQLISLQLYFTCRVTSDKEIHYESVHLTSRRCIICWASSEIFSICKMAKINDGSKQHDLYCRQSPVTRQHLLSKWYGNGDLCVFACAFSARLQYTRRKGICMSWPAPTPAHSGGRCYNCWWWWEFRSHNWQCNTSTSNLIDHSLA